MRNSSGYKRRRALLTAGAISIVALAPAIAEAETTLRVSCFLPERSISVSKALQPWMAAVEKEAAGELKFTGYWGGSLGRNPRKQYDILRDGITDVGYVVPGYNPGKFPDFGLYQLPFLTESAKEASVAIERMYRKGYVRGLEEVQMIGFFATDPNKLHMTKPISSLDDIKGKKIRTAGPVYADFVRALGGTPVGMPVTQLTESLSRGLLDGALLGWGGSFVFRLQSVTAYHLEAPLGVAAQFVAINKDKWNKLSQKAQAAIEKYSGEYMANLGGGGYDSFGVFARKKFAEAGKREIVTASPDQIAKLMAVAKPVHESWIASNENGAEKYEAVTQIIADIRAGK